MPARRWTTNAELELLQSHRDSFRSHQLSHSLQRFWPEVYNAWFAAFPEKPRILPNVEGELSEEQQERLQVAIRERKKQIYNWFNNLTSSQTRKAKAARVNLDILRPKNRRTLKDTELYSRKYYRDRIQPLVQTELGERVVTKDERIEVIKRWTREAYNTEDDEVKQEIREEIRAIRASREQSVKRSDSEGAEGDEEVTDEHVVGMAHGLRTESTTYERVRARNGTAIRRKASPRSTDLENTTRTGQIHSN